jgi:hypothetical protein
VKLDTRIEQLLHLAGTLEDEGNVLAVADAIESAGNAKMALLDALGKLPKVEP